MIQVLCVTTKLQFGGVQTFLKNYAAGLKECGVQYNFVVQTKERQPMDDYFESLGCKIFHITSMSESKIGFMRDLYCLLREHPEFQVVHSHLNFANVYSLISAKFAGVKVRISHSHSNYEPKSIINDLLKKIIKFIGWKLIATDCWACGKDAGLWLYGNSNKVKVIKNAIDTEKYRYNISIREKIRRKLKIEDDFVWINVGSFSKSKNHKFLLDIFSDYKKNRPNCKLILCGDGVERSHIQTLIKQKQLTDSVILTGNVNNCQDYLFVSDIFVFPSLFEGFPLSVAEAESTGLQCVLSNAIPDEVIDTKYAIKIDDYQKDKWISSIEYFRSNPLDSECRLQAIETIKQKGLDLKVEVNKLAQLYFTALGK